MRKTTIDQFALGVLVFFLAGTCGCGTQGVAISSSGQQTPFDVNTQVAAQISSGLNGLVGPGSPTSEAVPDLGLPQATSSTTTSASTLSAVPAEASGSTDTSLSGTTPQTATAATTSISDSASVASLESTYGIKIMGDFPAEGLENLKTALAAFPQDATKGATLNYTGQYVGDIGGTWQTGGLITVYQASVTTLSHELAHQIIEQNRKTWGTQLKNLLAANPEDIAPSEYSKEAAANGRWDEVAAESLAYFALGKWTPRSAQLRDHLQATLRNQPGAVA